MAAVLYVVLGVLMAVYVFIVGFSKLMIAFLLGVAPIAIGATIFEKTKGMFEAWLSAMIGYLMYPVASAGVIVAVVTVAHDVFRETKDVTDLGSILATAGFSMRAEPEPAPAPSSRRRVAMSTTTRVS